MSIQTTSSSLPDSAAAIQSLERTFAEWSALYLPALARGAARSIKALPGGKASVAYGNGYRDLLIDGHGQRIWIFPRSHAGERITVFRWLGEELDDLTYAELACDYAGVMVDDSDRGIYQGPEEEGRGMVWYWRDCGLYMTNYTMRLPRPLLELSTHRDDKYARAALLCGEQLLRSQRATGILRDGWAPQDPKPGLECPAHLKPVFLRDTVINSRVGHVASAYACLFRYTGDARYARAVDRLLHGLSLYQHDDGSFPTDIHSDRIEVFDPARKGHFMYYILNGFAEALLDMPAHNVLRKMAVKLADFICARFAICGACLYGDPLDVRGVAVEPNAWPMSSADPAYGLALLARITGREQYRRVALRLVLQAIGCVLLDDDRETYGIFPVYLSRPDKENPGLWTTNFGGHYHFNLLLGMRGLRLWPMQ